MKVKFFVFCALAVILCAFLLNSVRADDLENTLTGVGMDAEQAQEFIDSQRYNFIAGEWKGFLLENPFIQKIDAGLRQLNPIFIILFARSYSLSLDMLLVFMMWLFTLLSLPGYAYFMNQNSLKWLAALITTVIIAHLQVFNYLTGAAIKIIFYRPAWYWSLILFVVCIAMIVGFLYLNKYITGHLRAAREANEKHGFETRVKKIEAYQKGQSRGLED